MLGAVFKASFSKLTGSVMASDFPLGGDLRPLCFGDLVVSCGASSSSFSWSAFRDVVSPRMEPLSGTSPEVEGGSSVGVVSELADTLLVQPIFSRVFGCVACSFCLLKYVACLSCLLVLLA